MNESLSKPRTGMARTMVNPVIRKMERKTEEGAVPVENGCVATYGGIAIKTGIFLIVTVIGVIIYFALHEHFLNSALGDAIVVNQDIFSISMSIQELGVLIVAAVLAVVCPFLAWLIRPAVPAVGALYALGQGVIIGFITECLADGYKWIALLAMVLTIALVAAMLFLYAKRIVKVTARFKTIVTSLFITIILGSVILAILNFIPGLSRMMVGINEIMATPVVSIISSVVFIIIAAFFLLADFDTIERMVETPMSKQLEWMAAFGLAYTVLYIYFKILNLILTITSAGKKD